MNKKYLRNSTRNKIRTQHCIHALDKDMIKRSGRRIRNKQARFDTREPKS